MSDRDDDATLQVWADGERYVFHGPEVDEALARGREADTTAEAWEALFEYGREVKDQ